MILIKSIKKRANLLHTLLAAVFAYGVPFFGVLMDDNWYKYPYILGSHIIGLIILLIIHKWYLANLSRF